MDSSRKQLIVIASGQISVVSDGVRHLSVFKKKKSKHFVSYSSYSVGNMVVRLQWTMWKKVNLLLISTLPKNQADGDKWLVTEIIGSTLIWSPSMKNFHSTKYFLFLTVVAIETGFKYFLETGQNFSKRKLKIGSFHIDCWDWNTCHINLIPL